MTTETKSQAQHTPGPWHQMNDGLHECRVIQDNSGQRIAEADFGFDDNGLANARLIAAAPDLLNALRALLDTRCAEPEARAAIARACQLGPKGQ